jgi:hypothetical protein
VRQKGRREGGLNIFARVDGADDLALRDPRGAGLFAHLDSLAAKQEFLRATLHALRADSKALRAKSQALRVASHALRVESAGLRDESAALRARSWTLRCAAVEDFVADGRLFAAASARVSAQGWPDEIGTGQGKPPATASGGATGAELAPGDAMAHALCELTANLIRIVSGSGSSSDIIGQLLAVALALENYGDLATELPDERAVAECLRLDRGSLASAARDDPLSRRLRAEDDMIRAALQVAASRLMSQPALEALGLDELYQGIQSVLSLLPL